MKYKYKLLISTILFITFNSVAQATIVTFSDKSSFLSATGATSATGAIPDLGYVGASVTLGSVTLSYAPPGGGLWVGVNGNPLVLGGEWAPITPGNDIAIDGIENLNIDLASSVSAFGFDFLELSVGRDFPSGIVAGTCNLAVCTDSTLGVTLFDGLSSVGTFSFNAPDDILSFVGVSSDLAFNRVEIRDLTGTIDNEYFGEFYTTTTPAAVPEPSAMFLFGSGFVGLIGYAYRRRRQEVIQVRSI